MLLLLLSVDLGGAFGEASVDGTAVGAELLVDFEVEVGGNPTAVAAHVVDPGQTQETFSLIDRGAGRWGGAAQLDQINFVVVFEVLYAAGDGEVSEPTTLLQLGLDPELIGMAPPSGEADDGEAEGLTPATRRWGWGAVALAALALALLAVWAMGERPRRGTPETEEEAQAPS